MSEMGLLSYMLGKVDANGHFQQRQNTTAYDLLTTRPTVHRVEKELIRKGAVRVVRGSIRGDNSLNGLAILQPLASCPVIDMSTNGQEVMSTNGHEPQAIDNAQSSCPNGHLEPNTITTNTIKSPYIDNSVVDISINAGVDMKPVTEPYKTGQKNIPTLMFDRKRVPMCIECGLETVDFFDYKGSIDLEHFCDEETCGAKWQEDRRERMEREEETHQKAVFKEMTCAN
jgi:hypothetical protein